LRLLGQEHLLLLLLLLLQLLLVVEGLLLLVRLELLVLHLKRLGGWWWHSLKLLRVLHLKLHLLHLLQLVLVVDRGRRRQHGLWCKHGSRAITQQRLGAGAACAAGRAGVAIVAARTGSVALAVEHRGLGRREHAASAARGAGGRVGRGTRVTRPHRLSGHIVGMPSVVVVILHVIILKVKLVGVWNHLRRVALRRPHQLRLRNKEGRGKKNNKEKRTRKEKKKKASDGWAFKQ
jgi:hypothetical protein